MFDFRCCKEEIIPFTSERKLYTQKNNQYCNASRIRYTSADSLGNIYYC